MTPVLRYKQGAVKHLRNRLARECNIEGLPAGPLLPICYLQPRRISERGVQNRTHLPYALLPDALHRKHLLPNSGKLHTGRKRGGGGGGCSQMQCGGPAGAARGAARFATAPAAALAALLLTHFTRPQSRRLRRSILEPAQHFPQRARAPAPFS